MNLSIAYSPCPNDTFIFHAMVHGLIDTCGYSFNTALADVEELNRASETGIYDICKMSYSAYFGLTDKYIMLRSGSALGFNNGPLLVCRADTMLSEKELPGLRIAIPGKHTTAALLLGSLYPGCTNLTEILFSEIEDAVLSGKFDAGLLIHEGRFTYKNKGLSLIADLGKEWQKKTALPIPLGGIAIKRELIEHAGKLNNILRESIEYAFLNPSASKDYICANAQEMNPEVQKSHIELYVNDYTKDIGTLGEKAVYKLFDTACSLNSSINSSSNLFIY